MVLKLTKRREALSPENRVAYWLLFGASVIILLYAFSSGINGNDFWWHVKTGEWICKNGQIPKYAIFSWYGEQNNIPWIAHEWLSEVIFYWVYAAAGEIGIYTLSVLSALGMLLLLWNQAKEHIQKNFLIGGLFFTLFSVVTSVFFYGRPHLFSFFLLFWELKLLYGFLEDSNRKGIYLIPVIACLWSNIHGGSSNLSYLLCVAFLVVGVLNIRIGCISPCLMDKRSWMKLLIVTVLSVGAILINPAGLEMLLYPFKNMGDTVMLAVISEWSAPDAKEIGQLVMYYLPMILLLLGFFAYREKISLIDIGLMGVFVLLFLRSVRFIMLWYIAAVFCATKYFPECKIKPITKKTAKRLLCVCLVAGIVSLAGVFKNIHQTVTQDKLISKVISQEAIEAVKADAPQRLYNDYNLGEALIFNEIPVFYDARADIYAYENILAEGVGLLGLKPIDPDAEIAYMDAETLIQKYDFDAFLILKQRPLYTYLSSHSEKYTCAYEDDAVGYFRVIDEK